MNTIVACTRRIHSSSTLAFPNTVAYACAVQRTRNTNTKGGCALAIVIGVALAAVLFFNLSK